MTDSLIGAGEPGIPQPDSQTSPADAGVTAQDHEDLRRAIAESRDWTPPAERRWEIPPEPGSEVTAVRAALGCLYHRDGEFWSRVPGLTTRYRWPTLVLRRGPLTDATAELTEPQDGDGRAE